MQKGIIVISQKLLIDFKDWRKGSEVPSPTLPSLAFPPPSGSPTVTVYHHSQAGSGFPVYGRLALSGGTCNSCSFGNRILYPELMSSSQLAFISPYRHQVKQFQEWFRETFGESTTDGCQIIRAWCHPSSEAGNYTTREIEGSQMSHTSSTAAGKRGKHKQISEMLLMMHDATTVGVDLITISIGYAHALNFSDESISIGSFHAIKNGILTSNSAGNRGPRTDQLLVCLHG
ncbi:hypothetical protein CUMW_176340 [Citrus unshiu]|uniref:Peptidase S8/S53 domain-containing protein n=1 Tax=Citrus unshiu TaxID=55188 RepID=A0A2H5PXE2_CITUN|nr:hypothetical protein CUMW_176340 [Citrus unshiu]